MSNSPPASPKKSSLRPPSRTASMATPSRPASSLSNHSGITHTGSTRSTTNSFSSTSSRIKAALSIEPRTPSTRSTTPSSTSSATSKIKAALSIEARTKPKATNLLRPVSRPPSPKKPSRLEPPSSPQPPVYPFSKDPEEGLVDWTNVEADMSGEFDERDLESSTSPTDDEKVLVSVRVKPPGTERDSQAWVVSGSENLIKLDSRYTRSQVTKTQDYHFDSVLTGSDNRSIYNRAARAHVKAAMEGYNSLVFAYGQTASGKTFTLMGSEDEPGIIPRALKDVFGYIRATPTREFLLRASYLEIYNETVYDLLAPLSSGSVGPTITDAGIINLREEVVTSLRSIKEVIERGDSNRRTAATDWNERSSRSHSVFRLVIESREVSNDDDDDDGPTATVYGRPVTPGGTRLRNRGGRAVQSSILNLIDLAGSEKATSDKERTREGRYINTSLLTLGTVIATLAENSSRGKTDHVPYRNSKLTRMLQPCLSGNARISVICTLNPAASAIAESTSTLGFASRIKKVQLHAVKKEVIDTDALIERYRKEIEELKSRLSERERDAPVRNRRLSTKQQHEESRALNDMSGRIKQLTKLILTSETVGDKGDQSRPASPSKLDFSLSPFELQKELLAMKDQLDRQATLILSLEASLEQRAVVPLDSPEHEKDAKIVELQKQVKELEFVTQRYEENLGEPLRAVKEDVEKEWSTKLEAIEEKLRIQDAYVQECERALDKEKQARRKLEEEKKALVAFVCDLDSSLPSLRGLSTPTSQTFPPMTGTGFKPTLSALAESNPNTPSSSPARKPTGRVSSLTMGLPGSGRGTLFDQLPPEDIMLPLDSDDKENDLL